jgi:DNA-directed RNA polymerase specialized sigma24 family protein
MSASASNASAGFPLLKHKAAFPSTDWSALGRLREQPDDRTTEILNLLSSRYWLPICEFVRCRGFAEHEAQDLTQEFFAFAFETRLFARADRTRGRFRSFLLGAVRNFVENSRRKERTRKRRPVGGFVPLDEAMPPGSDRNVAPAWLGDSEETYNRLWMRTLIDHALAQLTADFRAAGRTTHLDLFAACVVKPVLEDGGGMTLEAAARAHGLDYKTAANRILTAKRAFRRLAAAEVARYAFDADDMAAEEREVLQMLNLSGHRD